MGRMRKVALKFDWARTWTIPVFLSGICEAWRGFERDDETSKTWTVTTLTEKWHWTNNSSWLLIQELTRPLELGKMLDVQVQKVANYGHTCEWQAVFMCCYGQLLSFKYRRKVKNFIQQEKAFQHIDLWGFAVHSQPTCNFTSSFIELLSIWERKIINCHCLIPIHTHTQLQSDCRWSQCFSFLCTIDTAWVPVAYLHCNSSFGDLINHSTTGAEIHIARTRFHRNRSKEIASRNLGWFPSPSHRDTEVNCNVLITSLVMFIGE